MKPSFGPTVLTPTLPALGGPAAALKAIHSLFPSHSIIDSLKRRMIPMALEHQDVFERKISLYPVNVCELTFASLFCWSKVFPHYLGKNSPHFFCEYKDHLIVGFYDTMGQLFLYQPIGPDPVEIIQELNTTPAAVEWTCIEESIARRVFGDADVIFERDHCDYLYTLPELRAMKGGKFQKKRTYIRHCEELKPTIVTLDASMASQCLDVNRKWLEQKPDPDATDAVALETALSSFDRFGLSGIGVLINGELQAFSIGEPLNPTTYCLHYQKANDAIHGLYQYVFHAFTKSIPESFQFLNREEDLGIEGLRITKEGWNPCAMVNKFSIRNPMKRQFLEKLSTREHKAVALAV
ncbi:MAG: phosphatidylglycerol lysyltransferase domain-containing protein [Candidatus Peregrinibacteria bacterium]